jgi:hypothetical protein
MRYPEGKIKEAILHPDPGIRDRAAWYFAKSFSPDPSIMPLVIRAVETHPKQDAYRLIGLSGGPAGLEMRRMLVTEKEYQCGP